MLGQYLQALSGVLGLCLLVICMDVLLTVGEGRDKPASHRWRRIGLAVGLVAAVVFAVLRGTAVIDRRSTVNLPTLICCVVLDALMIVVTIRAHALTRDWWRHHGRMNAANAVAAAGIAFTAFFAVPDVILQLTNFVDTGDSPFTSDMLLRALGFLLGVGVAMTAAAIFRTMRATAVRRSFTFAALLVVALQLARHLAELFSLLMNMMILVLHGTPFRLLIFFHNHELQMTYLQVLAFAVPAAASIVAGFRTAATGPNEAAVRSRIAFRRRAKTAGAWSLVAVILTTATLAWGTYEENKEPVVSPPEEYALVDGVATIPFAQVEDGHLHRFEYTASDGTAMRFIVIKKNGGAYGIGLDACETCGDAGYYEQDGKIICKRCDVAINLATIGFKGGCNPVPLPYEIGDGAITIQAADLDALSAHFR